MGLVRADRSHRYPTIAMNRKSEDMDMNDKNNTPASTDDIVSLATLVAGLNEQYDKVCHGLGRRLAEKHMEKHHDWSLDPVEKQYRKVWYKFARNVSVEFWVVTEWLTDWRSHCEQTYGENFEDAVPRFEVERATALVTDTLIRIDFDAEQLEVNRLNTMWDASPDEDGE